MLGGVEHHPQSPEPLDHLDPERADPGVQARDPHSGMARAFEGAGHTADR
ncbi:hypothetical protein [Streptosporangium sp. CA-115845]